MSGAIDVDGDLEAVLAARGHFEGAQLSRGDRARVALEALRIAGPRVLAAPARAGDRGAHRRAAALPLRDRAAIQPPLRRLQPLLRAAARPEHGLLVRVLRGPGRVARGRAGAQARADLPQAPAPAGRAAARHRLRLGLAADPRRRAPRRARRRRDALGRAGRAGARADPRRRAGRPDRDPRARLPRAAPTGRSTRSPASACTSTSAAASSTATCSTSTRCCVPAGCSSTTGSPGCARRRRTATPSSPATSSPTASCTP